MALKFLLMASGCKTMPPAIRALSRRPRPREAIPEEPLFPVHKAGKGGFIDKSGEVVIPLRFDTVGEFSDGFARAECAGKWGFINSSGDWVVRPRFAWAQDFSEGLARVQVDGEALTYNSHWEFIDKSGTVVIQPFVEGATLLRERG